jgi:hypothetical protein
MFLCTMEGGGFCTKWKQAKGKVNYISVQSRRGPHIVKTIGSQMAVRLSTLAPAALCSKVLI